MQIFWRRWRNVEEGRRRREEGVERGSDLIKIRRKVVLKIEIMIYMHLKT